MTINFEIQKYVREIDLNEGKKKYYDILSFANDNKILIEKIPFSIRILLENVMRSYEKKLSNSHHISQLLNWTKDSVPEEEFPYMPGRVLLQDFTGVPVVVDLASMRDAVADLGMEPSMINPIVRSDLVIDHSVQVDSFAQNDSMNLNILKEFDRNTERYKLLKWAQLAFSNFLVVPPGTGIVHQVNLENLAEVILSSENNFIYPDTCIGTDSHTTMINGVGVLGWGVGGIEAEAVMLGQPYYMQVPEVVGVNLDGNIPEGTTATDLVLSIVETLRGVGVVEKFVEFYGNGLKNLSLTDRATISNMAPEYGATCGFFPIDDRTIDYLALTGRPSDLIERVETYAKSNALFYQQDNYPEYSMNINFDLSDVRPSVAGPKRPQDKLLLSQVSKNFKDNFDFNSVDLSKEKLDNGSVVIAAITSCTNTSNPNVMVGAGLIAKKAFDMGIKPKPWVKTSLAPGSKVVTSYLEKSGLNYYLDKIGFQTVGYGCTTCIGNSGPLPNLISKKIEDEELTVSAVLSGNRNFEGRVHPQVKANYLASPMLVVIYALTGTINIDLSNDPIARNKDGTEVYLKDLWPTSDEIEDTINKSLNSKMFIEEYESVYAGPLEWQRLTAREENQFNWDINSTYIQKPPFFYDFNLTPYSKDKITGARCLVKLTDSVTTDHISPAGSIPQSAPSGQLLISNDVPRFEFNSYGSRRGNHNVMVRGTFGNIRLRNQLVDDEGDWTIFFPEDKKMRIFDASEKYQELGIPLIVIAGKEYGTGSSRDWAAKGPSLLGVKVVMAESYERIHRSNLVGMGIVPLQFLEGENANTLNIDGTETFDFQSLENKIKPNSEINVIARKQDGSFINFKTIIRIDTNIESEYYLHGGLLPFVLRKMIREQS
jgi:aconitate hydratase